MNASVHQRRHAAQRAVLQRGAHATPTRATRLPVSPGTSSMAPVRSTLPTRTRPYVYTTNGVSHGQADRDGLGGRRPDTKTLQIVVGNTAPTIEINTPLDGDFFEWGDKDPVHGHGDRPRGRPGRLLARRRDIRARARHARPRRGGQDGLLRARCRRWPRTRRTAATSPAASPRPTPTRAPMGSPRSARRTRTWSRCASSRSSTCRRTRARRWVRRRRPIRAAARCATASARSADCRQ